MLKRNSIMLPHLPTRPPVDIQFENLTYSVGDKRSKILLKNVEGEFRSGELAAIMGPSGAGKSTLMNSLAGYKTSHLSGTIQINGTERNLRKFRKMSCYIMHDDCLLPYLTVREALDISAHLKLGKCNKNQRDIIVNEVIENLGLVECVDTQTRCLSGGQRKRLSIALELVNNPPVMFLDEPTSGLDSSTCSQVISLLKSLARGGRTIICTIHQPSAKLFEMFDNLYLLAEGQCIYRGSVKELVPFMSSVGFNCPNYHNPADYVMEVASSKPGDSIFKLALAIKAQKPIGILKKQEISNIPYKETVIRYEEPQMGLQDCPVSEWVQFWILFKRSMLTQLRSNILTTMRFLAYTNVAIILIILFYNIGNEGGYVHNNAGLQFFVFMFVIFASMVPNILTFPLETSVFVREHLNHWYTLKAYYFAKSLADVPIHMLMCVSFVMSIHYFTGQPMEPKRIIMILIINFLASFITESYGLLIGAIFNIKQGIFFSNMSFGPLAIFCGFFESVKDMPATLRWLPDINFVKYIFEGTMVALYGLDRGKLDCNTDFCYYRYPENFLDEMSIKGDLNTYLFDVFVLLFILLVFRIATYLVLKIRVRQYG